MTGQEATLVREVLKTYRHTLSESIKRHTPSGFDHTILSLELKRTEEAIAVVGRELRGQPAT